MKHSFKTNSLYYFCQLSGALFFWGIIALIAISQDSYSVDPIAGLVENIILTILLSHFIIRKQIKAKSNYNHFNVKTYALAIVVASVIYATIQNINDMLFSSLAETKNPMEFSGPLVEFGVEVLSCMFLFSGWCIVYIAITSIRDKKILAQQLKEQQLASLMAQVNPHFLFNSLNTIRGMIYEDQDKAAELVTQLANLFRYSLSLDTKATTDLADEFQICLQYLAIESIRLESRLQLDIDVAPECLQCKIPTMGLLTLVENAIKHGIAHLQKGGILTVKAKVEDERLIINVINPYNEHLVQSGTKVGLYNLQQRIKLLFSDQGSLIQQDSSNSFHVTLNLPYELVKNA